MFGVFEMIYGGLGLGISVEYLGIVILIFWSVSGGRCYYLCLFYRGGSRSLERKMVCRVFTGRKYLS